MKRIVTLIFILMAISSYAQWQKVYENTGDYNAHDDVFFTSIDTGFVVGNGFNSLSYIISTTDGFETHSAYPKH